MKEECNSVDDYDTDEQPDGNCSLITIVHKCRLKMAPSYIQYRTDVTNSKIKSSNSNTGEQIPGFCN